MTDAMLKSELWVTSYGFPKLFGRSLVEGHVNPPHTYCLHVPSSTVQVHPPSDLTIGINLRLTRKPTGTLTLWCFGALALNASLLSTHDTFRSPELSKSRKLSTWFQPSGLLGTSITLHPKSFGVPKSQNPGVCYTPNPLESQTPELPEFWSLHQPLWLERNVPRDDT
jgi:hypothetical protein